MTEVFAALAPIFTVIALGLAMKRLGFPGDGFWIPAERLAYYVFVPALLVREIGAADFGAFAIGPLLAALVGTYVAAAVVMLAAGPRLGFRPASFATAFMAAIRFNTMAGLAAVVTLHGRPGIALFGVIIAVMIPLLNVLSVMALARHAGGLGARAVAVQIVRNPFILGCVVGIVVNLSGATLPDAVGGVLDILGRAALGVALLATGAGLTFDGIRTSLPLLGLACLVKLVALPAAVMLACRALGVGQFETHVAVLYATLPTSPAGFVLARLMGGEGALAAAIITATTVGAVATIPLMLGALL
ncbi:MAG: AEC family transporter [Alphaproteobacteria bacterium]